MRNETLFSHSGFYSFLLSSNALMHREATGDTIKILKPLLERRNREDAFRVLDLACGGQPIAIANVMAKFQDNTFRYTGVDINPDQIAQASEHFSFPENVTAPTFLEGNAWYLDPLPLEPDYHLIFSGMNLHHGTPDEIVFLGTQVRARLAPGGLFICHDTFRPIDTPYLPRPQMIDGDSSALLEPAVLSEAGIDFNINRSESRGAEPTWRADYLHRMHTLLLERGGDIRGVESSISHMRERDFPISTNELTAIMAPLGFRVDVNAYDHSTEPMGPYVAFCVLRAPNH